MLTKGIIKFIETLKDKKVRSKQKLFIVEGEKSIVELLKSDFNIHSLFVTKSFFNQYRTLIQARSRLVLELVEQGELERLGTFQSNAGGLALVHQKDQKEPILKHDDIVLVLSDVRDPGNLGTIIRIADWYGIKHIFASETTTDLYNHKTIAASMGSFLRVNVFYTNIVTFLQETKLPVFGALLQGENLHEVTFPVGGILVIGNESNGITKEVEANITKRITIPRFGDAESLNAGIATAVILDNWRRNIRD